MRTLPGVDHDDAFRMIDDPCVSREPAGPVPVGKNRKPPRQAVPLPLDLRGLDPDEPGLNGEDLHDGQEPAKCADFAMLDHDPLRLNRIMISSFCWSMISGQTLRVCPEGKPVPTRRVVARGHAFPDHALASSTCKQRYRAVPATVLKDCASRRPAVLARRRASRWAWDATALNGSKPGFADRPFHRIATIPTQSASRSLASRPFVTAARRGIACPASATSCIPTRSTTARPERQTVLPIESSISTRASFRQRWGYSPCFPEMP